MKNEGRTHCQFSVTRLPGCGPCQANRVPMRERGVWRPACGVSEPAMSLFLNETALPNRHLEKAELGFQRTSWTSDAEEAHRVRPRTREPDGVSSRTLTRNLSGGERCPARNIF